MLVDKTHIAERIAKLKRTAKGEFTDVEVAWENDQKLKDFKKKINHAFLAFAKLLYENKQGNYFKLMGYDTFEEYVAQPELGLERRSVYRLIGVYEDFIIKGQCDAASLLKCDYTKLDMVRKKIPEVGVGEAISLAQNLSRSDLKEELAGTHECEFVTKCRTCGKARLV